MTGIRFLVLKTMWKSRLVNVLAIGRRPPWVVMGPAYPGSCRRLGNRFSGETRRVYRSGGSGGYSSATQIWTRALGLPGREELPSPFQGFGDCGVTLPGAGKQRQPQATRLSSFGAVQ